MKICKVGIRWLVFGICFLFSLPANAETAKEAVSSPTALEKRGEVMTVTAQKSEENMQETPISLTVFDEFMVKDRNIDAVKDMGQYTPNLYFFSPGDFGLISPSIRGLYSDVASLSTTVSMYVDGVPFLNTVGFDTLLEDVERIEVLRGPQGTLYGKNAEAGVINVITKKPDNELRARIATEFGSDDKRQYTASVSGPLMKDKLYLGVSGRYYEKDGFLENTYLNHTANDRENKYGKVHLRYAPDTGLDVSLISQKIERDDGATSVNTMAAPNKREISSDIEGYAKLETTSHSLNIGYEFGSFKLQSVSAYKEEKDIRLTDMDATPMVFHHGSFDSTYETMSQELRVNYGSEKMTCLVGVYADKSDNAINSRVDSINPMYAGPKYTEAENTSLGLFTHVDYRFTEAFSVVAGIRYDEDDREMREKAKGIDLDTSYEEISPKFSVKYKVTPETMTYATVAKGYRSGGFYMFAPEGSRTYDKETLWNYEVGAKSSFFNNRLALNGSAYYMDISDMQVLTAIDHYTGYTSNAASASSKGVELEATYRMDIGISLFMGFGYNETTFDRFSDANGDYKGNYNPYAPKYNYNVGAQYQSTAGYFARVDVTGYGDMYLDKANLYKRDAYSLVNGKIGYEMEHFDVYVYAKNLFDKEYDIEGYYEGQFVFLSSPREVGVQLAYRF